MTLLFPNVYKGFLEMNCPKCGSDNCQRLEVVYDGGTQQINTTSRTAGGGIARGGVGGGAAHTTTSGTSQSTLASKAAPPMKKGIGGFIVMIVIGIFMLYGGWVLKLLGIGLIGYAIYLLKNTLDYNKNEFPEKYNFWKSQWMCHKCGDFFHKVFD